MDATDIESLVSTAEELTDENAKLKQQIQKMQETVAKATELKKQAEDKVGSLLTIIENLSIEVNLLRRQIEQNHVMQNEKLPPAEGPSTSQAQEPERLPSKKKVSAPTIPSEKTQRLSGVQAKKRASAAAIPVAATGPPTASKASSRRRSTPATSGAKGAVATSHGSLKNVSEKPAPRNKAKDQDKDKSVSDQVKYYPYSSLKVLEFKDLPPGVDRAQLERYLSDADFQEVFKMAREQFYSKPKWKQTQLKKQAGLF